MNGQSAIIQKTALLGSEANQKVTVYGKRDTVSREGLGLLDLLKLRFTFEQGARAFLLYFLIQFNNNSGRFLKGRKKNLVREIQNFLSKLGNVILEFYYNEICFLKNK